MSDSKFLTHMRQLQSEKMQAGKLSMWTVYERPDDYPDKFVARLFDIDDSGPKPTENIIITNDLEMMRNILAFELHLVCLTRSPGDDAYIVETWL